MHRLADTPTDHPALWGEIEVAPTSSIVIENKATMLPHIRKRGMPHWWTGYQHGAYKQEGVHIPALNDKRGYRNIFYPPASIDDAQYNRLRTIEQDLMIYAGTIFDHFGHLLLDLTRLYQLIRIYRHSNTTIWVHSHSQHPGKGVTSPLAQQWLRLLGMEGRIKVICRPTVAQTLVSSSVLYRDRCFASEDFHAATSTALSPDNQQHLSTIDRSKTQIAYLSRHKLTNGTTKFIQEAQLVEKLERHPEIDIICPEELDFLQKLELYKRYSVITGFPQACMNLKAFIPTGADIPPAKQVMLIAGPQSLSSNWINIDKACQFNDYYVDCPVPEGAEEQQDEDGFQRGNQFDIDKAYAAITNLIGEDLEA